MPLALFLGSTESPPAQACSPILYGASPRLLRAPWLLVAHYALTHVYQEPYLWGCPTALSILWKIPQCRATHLLSLPLLLFKIVNQSRIPDSTDLLSWISVHCAFSLGFPLPAVAPQPALSISTQGSFFRAQCNSPMKPFQIPSFPWLHHTS